ncbi:MAG: hypothetical protein HMLKMBBP_01120 [Planctomycetes bacterium]|nr:hypothetical protein [Planctomycetota bacterium]
MIGGGYHTHYPVLAAALAAIPDGPVLELGAGDWSTMMLHLMCSAQRRLLVTCESDAEWLDRYRGLASPFHRMEHVTDWDTHQSLDADRWAVVFVDHKPAEQRVRDIQRLRARTRMFVVHDTDPEWSGAYRFEPVLAQFRHRWDFALVRPMTTVVSDTDEFMVGLDPLGRAISPRP